MGGLASSLSKPSALTGKQFRDDPKAQDIKNMSDALFSYMYSNYDLKDVFDIANNPGEYVIAISDLITAQFHVLGYTTRQNKLGEIYFKKWTDLLPPHSASSLNSLKFSRTSDKKKDLLTKYWELQDSKDSKRGQAGYNKHEQHAKIIAFYFVRLFQILGSLLLVVKDGTFPELDSRGNELNIGTGDSRRAYASQAMSVYPKFRPPVQSYNNPVSPLAEGKNRSAPRNENPGPLQRGGGNIDTKLALGPYEFLRKYLKTYDPSYVKTQEDQYDDIKLPTPGDNVFTFDGSNDLFFSYKIPSDLPPVITKDTGGTQDFIMLLTLRNSKPELVTIKLHITDLDVFSPLSEYKAPSLFPDNKQYERYPRGIKLSLTKDTIRTNYTVEFRVNGVQENKKYENGVQYRIEGSPEFLQILNSHSIDRQRDFVKALELFVFTCINMSKPGYNYQRYNFKAKEQTYSYKEKIGKEIAPEGNPGLKATFDELKGTDGKKHYPHCIARALDLLDAASINGLGNLPNATTRICSSSIGSSEATGATYKPLKAVGQLYGRLDVNKLISVNPQEFAKAKTILEAFVTKGNSSKPSSTPLTVDELKNKMGQPDEANDLAYGIKRLTEAFHINNGIVQGSSSFDDIKLSKPKKCAGKTSDQQIAKGGPEFLEIQRYSQQLLAFHLNSVINISKFLETVFNIKKSGNSWIVEGPSTEILFAGFENLDELTKQARELLVNYYSGCESLYQKGVSAWDVPQAESGERVLVNPSQPIAPGPATAAAGPGPAASAGPGGPAASAGPVPLKPRI